MLTYKTAEGIKEQEIPDGHRIVKGTESGEDDLILMSRIARILGSVEELNEGTLEEPFNRLYRAYYGNNKSEGEINELVQAVIRSIRDGISIVIKLPPISPFVKAYYNTLKEAKELIHQAA